MKHPPYHLRPNKAVDRLLLLEVMKRLSQLFDFSKYTYYGFGGPFLEDCRLLAGFYPEMPMVSIEKNKQTYKRQLFHRHKKNLRLLNTDFKSFLTQYSGGKECIFWLDYTDLSYDRFDEFMRVLEKVGDNSIVKITVRADLRDTPFLSTEFSWVDPKIKVQEEEKFLEEFDNKYRDFLPKNIEKSDFRINNFVKLVNKMLQIASQKALPGALGRTFQILNSFHYFDNTVMLSITGVVCTDERANEIINNSKNREFINTKWADPIKIDLPLLSIKERLALEKHLPSKIKTGKSLLRSLGYNIDNGESRTLKMLKQYSDFYNFYPYFAKLIV